ncbi:NAD(P)-dependent alcohol dehydrogenase [Roseateles sp. DB2]|uniref:NAD(P)-dependent alcohol dehydrogenase n=1 Tax=Roseateles sp. DB2 TaxID=3453717 RepID=UPI003EEF8C86
MYLAKAFAAQRRGEPLTAWQVERRDLRPHDVLIEIDYCGVCHSDLHQARGEWGRQLFPMVPGHEIVGRVVRTGEAVSRRHSGDRVGVGCFVDSCRCCPSCRGGLEQYCSQGMTATYNSVERDGVTRTHGGYATAIVVDEAYTLAIPEALAPDAAAPLLCAGITMYSPLRHWGAGPGMRVAILGLGGLGHVGVKIARALGAEVTVLSHSPRKEQDAIRLGAHAFHSSTDFASELHLRGAFDLVLNTVSAGVDLDALAGLLRCNGTLVMLGISPEPHSIRGFSLIGQRRSLAGSTIGGIAETQDMLDFCASHGIACDIERISMQDINEAYERMLRGDVRYRFVIDMASLRV